MRKLTPIQKRELEFLKNNGGYRWICNAMRLNKTYEILQEKGLVRLQSGFGSYQYGTHVYLEQIKS